MKRESSHRPNIRELVGRHADGRLFSRAQRFYHCEKLLVLLLPECAASFLYGEVLWTAIAQSV